MSTRPRPCFLLAAAMLLCVAAAVADEASEAVDQNGNVHDWRPKAGAVTVVDFAASWCGPCRDTLPKLQALADRRPELRVLVISVDESVSGRDSLVSDLGLKVPVLWDENHRAAEFFRPGGMPSTFLYDRDGNPVLSYVGTGKKDWRRLVETLDTLTRD